MINQLPPESENHHRGDNGHCIVFLHGFMGHSGDWQKIVPWLQAKGWGTLTFDLPGHGKNLRAEDQSLWSMENTAEAIVQQIDLRGIDKPSIVGYSMGGRLALYLALNYPSCFSCAVVESASPGISGEEDRRLRREHDNQVAEAILRQPFEKFLVDWYRQPLFESISDHPDFPKMVRQRKSNDPLLLARSLQEMGTGTQPDLWPLLADIKLPLLLVIGERDTKFRAIAEKMVNFSPRIEQWTVENCGHNTHFEQPKQFAEIINQFLLNTYRRKTS